VQKGGSMKRSRYNVYTKSDSEYILFNTLTGAVAQIDEETKYLLEEDPNSIPENFLNMFLNNGFVVEDQYLPIASKNRNIMLFPMI
jgi:hypothetical protein